jgi:beta-mannosidase
MYKSIIFLFLMANFSFAQRNLTWEFYNSEKKAWQDFGQSGSIQEKLIADGTLPDPFYGKNEEKFDWVEQQNWELRSTIELSAEEVASEYLELYFPNIDLYAKVYVNDVLLYEAGNFFHPHNIKLRYKVKVGPNSVKLVFTPPVLYHKERYQKEAFHYPAPNDVNEIKIAPLTRKPQYQFGWDWALRMNTIGFSKPVQIRISKKVEIQNFVVNTLKVKGKTASLLYSFQIKDSSRDYTLKSKLFGNQNLNEILVEGDGNIIQLPFTLPNAQLWWPIGFGNQHLYTDSLTLLNSKNEVVDTKVVQFGVRTSKLVQNADKWGTSYEIHVNGIPIFCKGANYIPQEIFPAKVESQDIVKMIDQMVEANFNMVRVWGGGYYPDDIFFKTCDERGIMVWQDLMFACAMYPGDDAFLASVKTELNYQIPRISAHPSLVLFNGNNEVDVAWKNWGFQKQYNLKAKDEEIIEKAYYDLFKSLADVSIANWSNTSYIHTSPLSNWGNDDFYNQGSQHYWGVWHGKDPMSNFATKIGRFNAEYGFQSFPEFSTLATFAEKKDWNLYSDVMKHHQKSYVGNGMIEKQSDLLFGKAKDFEKFVYFSQLTQAYAVSTAVAGHRLDAPRCMGTIFWQLNDCWPAPTWSSIDYYGNWKALQYTIKEDYRQLAVLKKVNEKGQFSLWLKSDLKDTTITSVKIETFTLDGKLVNSKSTSIKLSYQSSQEIYNQLKTKTTDVLVRVTINKTYSRDFLISKKKSFPVNQVDLVLEKVDLLNKTAEIKLTTKTFLSDFWLYSNKLGVKFDCNFLNLLPGIHYFKIHFENEPILSDFNYKSR